MASRFVDPEADFKHAEQNRESVAYPDQPISPWERLAQGKTLGKRAIAIFNPAVAPSSGQGLDLLRIVADDSNAHQLCLTLSPPQVVTNFTAVMLLPQPQDASGERTNLQLAPTEAFEWANVVARVRWGVGGVQNEALVDFGNGLCVNLTAGFLEVSAFVDLGQPESIGEASPAAYAIRAFVGPGYPKSNNAQRTIHIPVLENILLAGSASPFIPLPAFAKDVTVVGVQKLAGLVTANPFSARIQFATGPAVAFVQSEIYFDQDNNVRVPVPNDSPWFRVVNNTASEVGSGTFAKAVFELSI